MTKRIAILIFLIVLTLSLFLFSACIDYRPSDDIPGINANAVMEIEHDRLNFALGMTVNSAEIIAKCNCTLTDDDGNTVKVTREHLITGKVSYTVFDTSTVGSNKQVKVSYKDNNYYISYDVDSYEVDLWLGEELYKKVEPTAYFTDDMQLACGLNLADCNYAVDPEVVRYNPEMGLRFCGWYDNDGNAKTGVIALQPPTHGNQRKLDLYAKFLSPEELAKYDLSYDLRGRKTFNGYNGPKVETLEIPESVTYVDVSVFAVNTTYSYVTIPSTASIAVPEARISTPNLLGISVSSDNHGFKGYNGALFDADLTVCYYVPSGITSIELPDSLVTIGKYAMACSSVSAVELPDSVMTLSQYCFAYSALESLGCEMDKITILEGAFTGTKFEKGFEIEGGALYYRITVEGEADKFGLSRIVDKSITNFKVKNGTVSIAGEAFNGCDALKTIDLGNDIVHIGESAFANCTSLEEVVLPDSLQTMGGSVFYGCSALKKAVVPDVSFIYNDKTYEHYLPNTMFRGCESLSNVTLSDKTKTIGSSAFYGCASLTSISLPADLVSIGSYAFCAAGLTSVTFPEKLASLGGSAFYNSAVTSVDFSQNKDLKKLSSYCFAYSKIKSVTIPERIPVLADHCFYVCGSLESVDITYVTEIGDHAFNTCSKLTQITFGQNLKKIGTRAFSGCKGLKSVTLPDSVEEVLGYAFASCASLTDFTFGPNVQVFGNFTFANGTDDFDAAAPVFYSSTALKSITVSPENEYFKSIDGVLYGKFVGGREFGPGAVLYYVPSAYPETSLTLPDAVKVVLPYSVYAQSKLTNVVLNNGLENIGKAAFYNSKKLASLSIPASVKHLGASILLGCTGVKTFAIDSLNTVYYSDGQLIYTQEGKELIMYLGFGGDVNIAEGTKKIAMGVFMNSTVIQSVKIPDSVEAIGEKAFKGCTNLVSLQIGKGLAEIQSETFAGLSALQTITVSSENEYFKVVDGLLYSKDGKKLVLVPAKGGMREFSIAAGVEEICDWAVSYNATLERLLLPVGVKKIGNYAFYECRALTYFKDSDALSYIGTYAFSFAKSINPDDSTDTRCSDTLKVVTLHGGITFIGDFAFYGQYGIEYLYFQMTVEEAFKLVALGSKNLVYLTTGCPDNSNPGQRHNEIKRCLYSEQEPEMSYNGYYWWHLVGGKPELWEEKQAEVK